MGRTIYTAQASVRGGRSAGRGRTSDGALEVDLRTPPEMGGEGGGTNPEQLFAVGYAACFEGAIAAVARRSRAAVDDVEIEASVDLRAGEDRSFAIAVRLDVKLPALDAEEAAELVAAAHRVCPYSNATRGNIEIELRANGAPVGA